jgi:hypothetical protein
MSDMGARIRGKYIVDSDGNVVPRLDTPDGVITPPVVPAVVIPPTEPMGPTRIGELLLVDMRVAKTVADDTKRYENLYNICTDLTERGACGVIESTLVIDILEANDADRRFLLTPQNWPKPR